MQFSECNRSTAMCDRIRGSLHYLTKSTLHGIEAIRSIKHGHIYGHIPGRKGEIGFVHKLFGIAA